MQVIVHCGAHSTEEDRLLKSLLRNREIFTKSKTAVPGPSSYRSLLKDCFATLEQGDPAPESRDVLWEAILDGADAERVILSNPHFWGSQRMALSFNQLYPNAELRCRFMQQLFQGDDIALHLGLRNPVGFIPGLLKNANPQRIKELQQDNSPLRVQWSELLLRLRASVPEIPITVWCYEDLPLVWPHVLRQFGALEAGARVNGGMDLLSDIMSKEGMQRLRSYLHQHPDFNDSQRQRVTLAFLDKYALEDELEEELDMPDWDDVLIEEATDAYERDLDRIANIGGVTMISPAVEP
ncbi:hypothetical protein GG681_08655 [Epibacterium sp. SM1969]|uniref:Uncharacterized protein n=1 Tax=Tritonibacter aquimaris TaxID=2663379 RepID=A0A844AXR2_9RHOB|nr:hypothetical protein [Tritonibacter aquimaris]MQY42712.1 hypothetical protein [Tritonibacter aquimaris]